MTAWPRSVANGLLSSLLLASCTTTEGAAPLLPPTRIFEDVFPPADAVTLGTPAESAGVIFSGLVAGDRLFVLDTKQGELRTYNRSNGAIISIPGRAGDDVGDLRHPIAIAPIDSGRFVLFDDKRRVLSFRDSLGRTLREVPVVGTLSGLASLPADRRLVLTGVVRERGRATKHDLQEFDYQGNAVASYGLRQDGKTEWQKKFDARFVTVIGARIVTGSMNSRRLRFFDRATARESWIDVAPGWHRLEWPSDAVLRRKATQQTVAERITSWARQNRLMNAAFPLSDGSLVVRYLGWTPSGSRLFYYVWADSTGAARAVTHGTRTNLLATHADTLFWVAQQEDGRTTFGFSLAKADPRSF